MSYYHFYVEILAEGHHFTQEIVEGVVRHRNLVVKRKVGKFFPSVFVSDSQKFMLAKICRYTVTHSIVAVELISLLLLAPYLLPFLPYVLSFLTRSSLPLPSPHFSFSFPLFVLQVSPRPPMLNKV